MSVINSISHEILISLINSCAENPSDTKSKDIITDICENLKYHEENIEIFKLIFENKVFYPLPKKVFSLSCTNGLIELVECLLKNMEDIPTIFNYQSAIYVTLHNGHTNIAKLLIEKKIFVKTGEILGINGLDLACESGYFEIVKLLLEACVKTHETSSDAIYNAAKQGHYEIVKLLLDYPKVDPTAKNKSAIYVAAKNNYDDIVKLILQKRANVTSTIFGSDSDTNKKIISIYNELYPVPSIGIPVSSNNNECLNDLLKKLQQEMVKQNISKITITSDSILVTNDFKI